MSRGPGKIEQAIIAAFEAEPDNAFTVADLCDRAFPGTNRIERKHHVSVIRAANKLASRRDDIWSFQSGGLGGTLVFFNRFNVMSHAMSMLKAGGRQYRNNDKRSRRGRTEDDLRASIAPGGVHHHHVVKGGLWRLYTELAIAQERDGDTAKVAEIDKELASKMAAIWAGFRTG